MTVRALVQRLLGIDETNERAHQIKNEMTAEILAIHRQADRTARRVARATGRVK